MSRMCYVQTAYGTFLAAAAHFPVGGKALIMESQMKFTGRRLLQVILTMIVLK